MVGNNGKVITVLWQSKCVRKIVKQSTLSADVLTITNLAEAIIFYRKYMLELFRLEDEARNVPIICYSDNSICSIFFYWDSGQESVLKLLPLEAK